MIDSIGYDFIKQLGYREIVSDDDRRRFFVEKLGTVNSEKAWKLLQDRRKFDNRYFYSQKNKTLKNALAITLGVEGWAIAEICNWIAQNGDSFNGEVLDIGCDCGIIACFIAKRFPSVNVTGIDICESSIRTATELATQLGLSNVRFEKCDLKSNVDEYDVVFSGRTLMENITFPEENFLLGNIGMAERCRDSFSPYAAMLSKHVKPTGCLISVERLSFNPGLLGWFMALNDQDMALKIDRCKMIEAQSDFMATISQKGSSLAFEPLYKLYALCIEKHLEYDSAIYRSWDATYLLEKNTEKLVDGYYGYDRNDKRFLKFAIYTHLGDPTTLIIDQRIRDPRLCQYSRLDNTKSKLDDGVKVFYHDLNDWYQKRRITKITQISILDGVETEADVTDRITKMSYQT